MNRLNDNSGVMHNFETGDSEESTKLVIDETISNDGPQNIIENTECITNTTACFVEPLIKTDEHLILDMNIQKDVTNTSDPYGKLIGLEKVRDVDGELRNCKTSESISTEYLYPKQGAAAVPTRTIIEIVDDEANNSVLINPLETPNYKNNVEDTTRIDYAMVNHDENESLNEIFYDKECVNYECPHNHKQFCKAPLFTFSYFKLPKKKSQARYICLECYDMVVDAYEAYCNLLKARQPLLLRNIPSERHEYVEISDSSDEDNEATCTRINEEEFQKPDMTANNLELIDAELNNTIKSVMIDTDIQSQLTWTKAILMERIERMKMETTYLNNQLNMLEMNVNKIHESLYDHCKVNMEALSPLEVISNYPERSMASLPDSIINANNLEIPPAGEVVRPPIQLNAVYYAVKNNAIARWVPCKLIEYVDTCPNNIKHYKIRFLKSAYHLLKTVPAKHLAYYNPPDVKLSIGERVIAFFDATSLARGKEKINVQSAFYPGIIAETIKPSNKFRYLIFYDDGYTQYVYHKDVRLVCHVSENVWEDVHSESRDFIKKYLTHYTINRPMVQTQKGQTMSTQSGGHWVHARVVDIDCSLVLMQFEGPRCHTEWIYRGSLRLAPVFKEDQKFLNSTSSSFTTTPPSTRLSRRTEPFIRYTVDEEASSVQQQTDRARAVARKTISRPLSTQFSSRASYSSTFNQHFHWQSPQLPQKPLKHLNNSTIYVEDENKPKGKVVYYTAKRNLPPRKYVPHNCSPLCLIDINNNLNPYSPLSKPLLSGWERLIIRQKIKKGIAYRAPCGKIMRNMSDLHYYLRAAQSPLNVDNFDFNIETNCLAEYVIESAIVQKRDISNGQEKMAIPLVNYYDNTLPPECKYSSKVIPTEGVHINKDIDFLIGCDCKDDCSDKQKCSCWQLTLAGAKYGNSNTPVDDVGYRYKRLMEHVPTGIYECNARCKCKMNCLNRVVQQPLQMKLQVFKTSNRGWGLRCINDIPKGSFVCIYAGHLLTEAKANEGGLDAGDEYFAELDYIEVAEQIKEGYESDVEAIEENDEEFYNPGREDDDEFTPSTSYLARSKAKNRNRSNFHQDDDFQERQIIKFNPDADLNEDSLRESSIRKLFGKDEACYVMDAKITGNLGRYFNHSCSPNLFVQNVFVDTHDLRFPWVAFFSSCHIRAGTELTWNYNYEVGVVPGKVLYCQCGASNCRIRLL